MNKLTLILCFSFFISLPILHSTNSPDIENPNVITEWKLKKDKSNKSLYFENANDSRRILKKRNVYSIFNGGKLEYWFDYNNKLRSPDGLTIVKLKNDVLTHQENKYTIKSDHNLITLIDGDQELLKLIWNSKDQKIIIEGNKNFSVVPNIVDFLLLKLSATQLGKITCSDEFSTFWNLTFSINKPVFSSIQFNDLIF